MERTVDIIIPTFNAYDHAAACIGSVLNHTAEMNYRLILVNDASTDERIDGFYRSLAGGHVLYLKNEINLGFVKSANLGMRQSETNDVLLLNTDTVVTKDWLKNLGQAAYKNPDTGGAIPLSNRASVYSMPELSPFHEAGSIQKTAEILSGYPGDSIHEIPTAVGFCFYIKREVIRKIGFFDEIFGRGYGEENDFCMRARERGYRFVLADNAFVYHAGHVSMREAGVVGQGEMTVKAHEKILHRRYPYYQKINAEYLASKAFDKIRRQTVERVRLGLRSARRKILFFLHHPIDGRSTGGAEFHVSDLVRSLQGIYTCYVAYIHDRRVFVEEYAQGLRSIFLFDLPCPPFFLSLKNPPLEELFRKILRDFEIEILHMHLTMNNSLDMVYAAKSLGLPVLMTLHDYYALSPDFNLLYKFKNEKWEEGREPLTEYFFARYGVWGIDIREWRREMAEALRAVDELIFPSESALNEFQKIFWRAPGVKVIEHGAPSYCQKASLFEKKNAEPFSICFLGYSHARHKGYELIKKIIPRLLHQNIVVHMLGTEPRYWKKFLREKNFHVHGAYKREEVMDKLRQIKPSMAALVSIWPETYAYTLTEAWAAGIPVMVGPLGATAERVKRHGGGVVLKDFDPASFVEEVLRLKHRRSLFEKLAEEIKNLKWRTVEDARADYRELYEFYLKGRQRPPSFVPPPLSSPRIAGEGEEGGGNALQSYQEYTVPKGRDYAEEFLNFAQLFRAKLRRGAGRVLYWFLDSVLRKKAPAPERLSIEQETKIVSAQIPADHLASTGVF